MPYTISDVNRMSQATFVKVFGSVFEHTPAIATHAWAKRPFADSHDLHQTMTDIVDRLSYEDKRALICAHPDLGSRATMAEASVNEQAGAGLNRLNPQDYDRLQMLNNAYHARFGFPFIVAVKHHTLSSIFETLEHRLNHSVETEMQQALLEISHIAWFRLSNLIHQGDNRAE